MKHYIFFALMLFSLHLGAQCVIPITEVNKTIYVPIDEIAYVVPSGTGASIVRQAGLRQLNTVEDVDSIVSLCSPSLLKFTDGSNGKVMAVSKTFIDRVVINGNGKAVIQTKNARIAYISFEDAADLDSDIIACYGAGEPEGIDSTFVRNDSIFLSADGNEYFTGVASGGDGNGIYSGSGTLSSGDTTIVTIPNKSALKVGNTIQSPTEITTIQDANHWGTYNGWDRATYSFGGFSGYYFIRGNGTAANKTALNVNNVMHEWAFIGQKSPTEDNYALIMKPTVDEIIGGNNWGRLDFQGADFGTWLSLRRTGIRAGTAANYTTFPALRPVGSNQLWQYNTDGTGQYTTPGAMTVTNPLGGENTLQASLDSIYDPCTISRTEQVADATTWTAYSATAANLWKGVTYGNGLFVAVSESGTNRVMTSPDGITWTDGTSSELNSWQSVTYGNGLFVAVASSGTNRVMTSPDGVTWTARSATAANLWRGVTYGNGLFVAVSESGTNRVMTSPDGITWTARTAAEANSWQCVTYGNGLFVAVAVTGTNRIMTSPDGITWTARTAPEANLWSDVIFGNGLFVAISGNGTNRVMTSPDGITWTARTAAEANTWTSIAYGNGLFVAVSSSGVNQVMTSPDGTTWTSQSEAAANAWQHIVHGNGRFVAVSSNGTNRVMTSGTTFVEVCPKNPYGGDDTMQGIIDSIYQNSKYTAGSGIDISIGGVISATDNSATNEIQTLSIAGNNLTLSNGGGTVAVPSGADGNGIYGGSGTLPINGAYVSSNLGNGSDFNFGVPAGDGFTYRTGIRDTVSGYVYSIGSDFVPAFPTASTYSFGRRLLSNTNIYSSLTLSSSGLTLFKFTQSQSGGFRLLGADTIGAPVFPYIFSTNGAIRTGNDLSGADFSFTTIPSVRPSGSAAFWQHNIDGTGEYKTPGAMTVTNPAGGTNTLQAALDSIMDAATWLKPQLEAANVTINSLFNTLTFTTNSTKPPIHVDHPNPVSNNFYNILTAARNDTGNEFAIRQLDTNAYNIQTSQSLLRLESNSAGDPFAATLGGNSTSGLFIEGGGNPAEIGLFDATDHTVKIAASATTSENWTLTLPTTDGSSGQFLQTNGSGVTSWVFPTAPTNVGGISILYTGPGVSYTAQPLGDVTDNISFPTTVGSKVGLTKTNSGAGHGIGVNFGGLALCEISAFVTITNSTDNFYLQVYLDSSPIYSGMYAATNSGSVGDTRSASISFLHDIPAGGVVTMRLHSTDSNTCTILSSGLTVSKNQ